MTGAVLLEQRWWCPSCGLEDRTDHGSAGIIDGQAVAASRMHDCPALGFLSTPLLPAGVNGKHEAVERPDYVGDEDVRYDANGRPVMAIVTTRDEGQDCTVFAPTAHAGLRTIAEQGGERYDEVRAELLKEPTR